MEASTKTVQSTIKLQSWFRKILHYRQLKLRLVKAVEGKDLTKIAQILGAFVFQEQAQGGLSFELCQQLLFNDEFFHLFSTCIQIIFDSSMLNFLSFLQIHDVHTSQYQVPSSSDITGNVSVGNKTHGTTSLNTRHQQHLQKSFLKTVLSSFLIAKFPLDILNSAESSSPRSPGGRDNEDVDYSELKLKSGKCFYFAKLLLKHLHRLFAFLVRYWYTSQTTDNPLPTWIELLKFQALFHNNVFIIQYFMSAFQDWKRLDSLLLVNSLEQTLQQSYYQYLLAKYDQAQQQDNISVATASAVVSASEQQVQRIQDILHRVIGGKKAASRIEEIKATVEASNPQLTPSHLTSSSNLSHGARGAVDVIDELATAQILQNSSPDNAVGTAALKQLEMVSKLAGMEGELLAYEIAYDRNFRLPAKQLAIPAKELIDSDAHESNEEDNSMAAYVKRRLLSRIADQLINSLRKSNVNSYDTVAEGMLVPVLVSERFPSLEGRELAQSFYLTAKVLHVYDMNEAGESGNGQKTIDVEFLVDETVERNVGIERVKLASKANEASILIQSLYDVIHQVHLLIPNRKDLQTKLLQCFDADLLTQMVSRDSLSLRDDLLPILSFIYEFAENLQAEYRLPYSKQWFACFSQAFDDSLAEDAKQSNPIIKRCHDRFISLTNESANNSMSSFEKTLSVLPIFFERITECVEEIQRDMANYYISLLAPVLHTHGHNFLLQCFQQRLRVGDASIHAISALVHQQLAPEESFIQTVNEFVEAEVFHATDAMTLRFFTDSIQTSPDLIRALFGRVFLSVLQLPYRLDSVHVIQQRLLPETLFFDTKRMSIIRDLIDKIVLENSLLVTIKQILSAKYKIIFHENEESEFIHRIDVLLSQHDLNLLQINTECLRFAKSLIFVREQQQTNIQYSSNIAEPVTTAQVQDRYNEQGLAANLEKTIADVVKEANPVLQLFQKRMYKLLLRILLDKPYQQKLRQYSLHAKGHERNLHQLFTLARALFRHNLRVHLPVYYAITTTCLQNLTQDV